MASTSFSADQVSTEVQVTQTNIHFNAGPVPIPPGPFDLQTCFELAILRSETLGMKEEDIRAAEARYWQAVGASLPKIHILTSERLRDSNGGSSSSFSDSQTSNGSFSGNSKDRFETSLNVRQPLFSGFREISTAAATKAEIQAKKHDKQRALQLLYLDVTDVFFQILFYEADLKVIREIQKTLEQRVDELKKRILLGRSRQGELLLTETDLANTKVTFEQVHGLLGASLELMSFLTGVPSNSLKLKDSQSLPNPEELASYLESGQERPDVLAAQQTEKSAEKQLSAAKGEHWPTIAAEGNYYLKEHPNVNRKWDVLLSLDLPIFEGGLIEARVRERKALVRSSQLNLEQLRRTTMKDVRTAYNNFLSSSAQVLRLQEAKKVATQNYEVQIKDYKLGIVSNLDVLESLRQMQDAERRLLSAQMDAKANLIRLHVAAGKTSEANP